MVLGKRMKSIKSTKDMKSEEEKMHAYEILKRSLTDEKFLEALNDNPEQTFRQYGVTDPSEIDTLKELIVLLISGSERGLGDEKVFAYEILKRAADDTEFLTSIVDNPDKTILQYGVTDPNEVAKLSQLLILLFSGVSRELETAELMAKQSSSTHETVITFKTGLQKTIEQIDSGFRSSMRMYEVAFSLGVALIVAAIVLAFRDGISLFTVGFGGVGVLDFIAFFIARPAQNLQSSRADLAQLQAAFFNWFADTVNWNEYLRHLANNEKVSFADIKAVSDVLLDNTEKTMSAIQKYCSRSSEK